jgi:hypothetical protein
MAEALVWAASWAEISGNAEETMPADEREAAEVMVERSTGADTM